MKVRIFQDESISIVDEWDDENSVQQYDDYNEYVISDDGCSDNNCVIADNRVGTNGGCKCLRHIPFIYRGIVRQFLEEESK